VFRQIPTSVESNSVYALVEFKNYASKRVILAVSKVTLSPHSAFVSAVHSTLEK
jgi:hypothetical protein